MKQRVARMTPFSWPALRSMQEWEILFTPEKTFGGEQIP